MKKKLPYHLFFVLATGLLFAVNTHAQEGTATADSTAIQTAPPEEYDSSDEEETYYPDTLTSNYRSVVYDSVMAITTDKGFYYKRYMDSLLRATQMKVKRTSKRVNSDNFFSSIFGVIFWIAAIALFAYLVYRLFLSNSSIFSRNRKNISSDITVVEEENSNDQEAVLRNAIKNGNYRLAIRYLYLQALLRLSEKKFIEINANKTNYEYVNEIRKHKFANEFAALTLQYEYVWYGEYPVDERLFEQIHKGFNQFNKNIGR